MKFFKEADFNTIVAQIFKAGYKSIVLGDMWESEATVVDVVNIANAKLEKEGQRVYADNKGNVWEVGQQVGDKIQALLINIEPVKKETREDILQEFFNAVCFSAAHGNATVFKSFIDGTLERLKKI